MGNYNEMISISGGCQGYINVVGVTSHLARRDHSYSYLPPSFARHDRTKPFPAAHHRQFYVFCSPSFKYFVLHHHVQRIQAEMAPASKKRKTTDVADAVECISQELTLPLLPIIYKAPGLIPDARLNVFGQEYHCHSVSEKARGRT